LLARPVKPSFFMALRHMIEGNEEEQGFRPAFL
jgi:hypothetical protein